MENKAKLISKTAGRTLHEFSASLNDLGITSKSKVMVIGKKFDMAEQQKILAIEKINELTEELWQKFDEILTEITGIKNGYLEPSQAKESLNKLTKKTKYLGEGLMKNLETLDAMTLESSQADARDKRKTAITTINNYIAEVDKQEEYLKEFTLRY